MLALVNHQFQLNLSHKKSEHQNISFETRTYIHFFIPYTLKTRKVVSLDYQSLLTLNLIL